jgi:hypothetical protein
MKKHVAVWMHDKEARIFQLEPGTTQGKSSFLVRLCSIHHKPPERATDRLAEQRADARRFLSDIAREVDDADEILIVGPSTAKVDLITYIHRYERALEAKVVAVETVERPTNDELVANALRYFSPAPPPVPRTSAVPSAAVSPPASPAASPPAPRPAAASAEQPVGPEPRPTSPPPPDSDPPSDPLRSV